MNSQALINFTHEHVDGALPANGEDIINNLLDARKRASELLKSISESYHELNNLLTEYNPALKSEQPVSLAYTVNENLCSVGADIAPPVDKCESLLDAHFWTVARSSTSMEAMMNTKAQEKLAEITSVYKPHPECPAFDQETVFGTMSHYLGNRWLMFVEGALELFKDLDKGFKTNDGIRIGSKIIIPSVFSGPYTHSYSNGPARLTDLQRIFMVLDGKDPTKERSFARHVEKHLSEYRETKETDYFKIKACRNGNVHINLLRSDLVSKFNGLLSQYHAGLLGHRSGVRN
jgi:hypothetical protein